MMASILPYSKYYSLPAQRRDLTYGATACWLPGQHASNASMDNPAKGLRNRCRPVGPTTEGLGLESPEFFWTAILIAFLTSTAALAGLPSEKPDLPVR